jgi:hypothetical protein
MGARMSGAGSFVTGARSLAMARILAAEAGCVVAEVRERDGLAYVVYRRAPGERKGQRIARRSSPAALLALLRRMAGGGK